MAHLLLHLSKKETMTLATSDIASIGAACPLGNVNSAEDLAVIHRSSVVRHAQILAAPQQAQEKIIGYFIDLKDFFLDSHFGGCPFTNALRNSGHLDRDILKEVRDHKEFIRQFFANLAKEFCTPARAQRTGELLFLLYSGAATESQNLQQIWPVESAILAVDEILREEVSLAEFSQGID